MRTPAAAAAPVTVLVIDDNPVDRDLFRRLLAAPNASIRCECFEGEFGRTGLSEYRRLHPKCVLLDLNLPDVDGMDLLRDILSEPDPCPVIVTTAYGSEQVAVDAMKTGAADYVVKGSVSAEGLSRVIENALEKRALQRKVEEQRRALEERNRLLESSLERERLARAAVEQSENRYRTLAEAMPQVVWTAEHPGGEWNWVNQRWVRLTGSAADRAAGRGWLDFVDADDRLRVSTAWERAVGSHAPLELQCRVRDQEGAPRWQLMRALPLIESGQPVKWLGTFTDIEEQRRAEQLLHQRQKLESIGILAGGVAHDFNNLLVGIVGGVSYALDVLPPGHELQPILDNALRSGERAAHLTRQMLAYAGKGTFHVERVDVGQVLRATHEMIQSSIPNAVEVRLLVPPDLPPVYTDAIQFQQIAMNLVINAAEAIPAGRRGLVTVHAGIDRLSESRSTWSGDLAPGEYLNLEVRDNGSGIDAETLPRIFDPFFTTKFTGRGLGLAAVQGIVRSNGGAIEVESTPSEGSIFRVRLPAGVPSQVAAAESAVPAVAPVSGRVLVVDDEPVVCSTARAVLERAGHTVAAVSSGRAAVEALSRATEPFSAVLLDYSMPGMDGDETLSELRRVDRAVPIVICSGYSESELRERFGGRPVDGFLHKPFNSRALTDKISELLGAR